MSNGCCFGAVSATQKAGWAAALDIQLSGNKLLKSLPGGAQPCLSSGIASHNLHAGLTVLYDHCSSSETI
jgi:hypothetical protein